MPQKPIGGPISEEEQAVARVLTRAATRASTREAPRKSAAALLSSAVMFEKRTLTPSIASNIVEKIVEGVGLDAGAAAVILGTGFISAGDPDYGTAKNRAALQNAINAAQDLVVAGTVPRAVVYVPAGDWAISGAKLAVTASGIYVLAHPGARIYRVAGENIPVLLDFNAFTTRLSNVGVFGGVWDGGGPVGLSGSNGIGIRFANCESFDAGFLEIHDTRSTALLCTKGSSTQNALDGRVSGVRVARVGNFASDANGDFNPQGIIPANEPAIEPDGLGMTGCSRMQVERVSVRKVVSRGNGITCFEGCQDIQVSDCYVESVDSSGFAVDAVAGTGDHERISYSNCIVKAAGAGGLRLIARGSSGNAIRDVTASGLQIHGTAGVDGFGETVGPGHAIHLNADAVGRIEDVRISGLLAEDIAGSVLATNRASRVSVSGVARSYGAFYSDDLAGGSLSSSVDIGGLRDPEVAGETLSASAALTHAQTPIFVDTASVTLTLPSAVGVAGHEMVARNISGSDITYNGATLATATTARYVSDGSAWQAV